MLFVIKDFSRLVWINFAISGVLLVVVKFVLDFAMRDREEILDVGKWVALAQKPGPEKRLSMGISAAKLLHLVCAVWIRCP